MNWIPMSRTLLLLAMSQFGFFDLLVLKADPPTLKSGGTLYLKDAESYMNKAPILPKIAAAPTPSPTLTPTPNPTATPSPKQLTDSDDDVKPIRDYPPAIIHSSSMNVGRHIPVPTHYAPPQVASSQNGGVTVVPATPTTFQTLQTGVTAGIDASCNTTFQDTEVSGVVNYGQQIRAVVPVFNSQGQRIGNQVITVSSNPVLLPITTTIQLNQ